MMKFVLIASLFFYFASSPNWGTRTRTVYQLFCSDLTSHPIDCPKHTLVSKSTYLAIPETQQIISKGLLISHNDCTVFNVKNWRCGNILMRGGRYMNLDEGQGSLKAQQITRIEYIARSIIGLF